ncbi:MAG: SDR family oxidoreductase [Rhodospirillales bacterium]|nr:SDR family oxidoreductase [Rhodospirillales bacterium]
MHGKVCLVTGASSGIGRAAALELAERGATVVLVCRNEERGAPVLAEIERRSGSGTATLLTADLASQRQVREAAAAFLERFDRLDVLINNAGVAGWGTRLVTEEGLERTFAVNHLAPFLLTGLLLDRLKASAPARVVTVSSAAHKCYRLHLDDLQGERHYSGFGAYSRSKLANVLFTQELSRRLAGFGVTANCLHPGVVATGIFRNIPRWMRAILTSQLVLSPEKGADTMLYLATAPEVAEVTGQYFVRRRPVRTSRASRDASLARRLWEASEALTAARDA